MDSQLVNCDQYPPYSLKEVKESEITTTNGSQPETEDVEIVAEFREPIPTREYKYP